MTGIRHGLRANPCFDPARHKVHCFDNFLVNDGLTIDFIATELGQRLATAALRRVHQP